MVGARKPTEGSTEQNVFVRLITQREFRIGRATDGATVGVMTQSVSFVNGMSNSVKIALTSRVSLTRRDFDVE